MSLTLEIQAAVEEFKSSDENVLPYYWNMLERALQNHPEMTGEIYNDGIVKVVVSWPDNVVKLEMWRID